MSDKADVSRPTVVITGAPNWAEAAAQKLRELTYTPIRYMERAGYVARLADDGAALILVDGDDPDWRFWAVTPRTSPATRRIPIIFVTDDAARRQVALTSGANLALTPTQLGAPLPGLR